MVGESQLPESLEPNDNGAPGGIRTPDQVVRSHLLYPAELRADIVFNRLPKKGQIDQAAMIRRLLDGV